MNGHTGGVRDSYEAESSFVFVIGGDGVILYRGFFDDDAVRTVVDAGLAALSPAIVPDTPQLTHQFSGGYPNPFNPATQLTFSLDDNANPQLAQLEIVDLQGRILKVLWSETATAGRNYVTTWYGRDASGRAMASGIYFARLKVGDWSATRSLALVK